MPIHDWTRVEAGIFHAFHHRWISAICDALNDGLLPPDYYALAEQHAAGLGPDVLTLQEPTDDSIDPEPPSSAGPTVGVLAEPKVRYRAETPHEFYRRKKSRIAVRHVSNDRVVAILEIVSPGNKSGRNGFQPFLEKVLELLEARVHLLLIDLFPPTKRDPHGIHSAIWEAMTEEVFEPPADKPLTLVAYECSLVTRAYLEPVAIGDKLIDMPLFLEPGMHILIPMETTYQIAWTSVPRRWRRVIDPTEAN